MAVTSIVVGESKDSWRMKVYPNISFEGPGMEVIVEKVRGIVPCRRGLISSRWFLTDPVTNIACAASCQTDAMHNFHLTL